MHTERAKNAVIIILIVLNAVVYLLNMERAGAFSLTTAQEDAIQQMLARNNISNYASFEGVSDFSPRRQMSTASFDYGILQGLLLGSENVQETSGFERAIKTSPRGRVVLTQNNLTFEAAREPGTVIPQITEEEAEARADAFLTELTAAADLNFTFSRIYTQLQTGGSDYVVFYLGVYNGTVIASNYARFLIDGAGIAQLSCTLAIPEGLTGQSREICSADEALFTLCSEMPEEYAEHNNTTFLMKMELVYFMAERGGDRSVAIPYYMFTTRRAQDEPDRQERHLINAYTNSYYR
ncbi:MAG: hypothetical protein LBS19_16915 [Clostridiales bacterium]|jgi:hypothetical protein|nr:hypothetical protein [Clostridiales bacterium]